MNAPPLDGLDVDHFVKRLLTDCLAEATRNYWLRRAADFENARPRLGEFHGTATRSELRQRWRELSDMADACRARAQVAPLDEIDPDVEAVLSEVA